MIPMYLLLSLRRALSLPLLPPAVCVIWRVQEASELQCVPSRLVNVLEAVRAQVDPAKVACDDNKHVIDFLLAKKMSETRRVWSAYALIFEEDGQACHRRLSHRRHRYLKGE